MIEQEKQLLLADLCARLPYGVKYKTYLGDVFTLKDITFSKTTTEYYIDDNAFSVYQIKPFLRPMSSMTEEEKKEFHHVASLQRNYLGDDIFYTHWQIYDWLNKNYFDYRGLISKGLALEVPKEMYNS